MTGNIRSCRRGRGPSPRVGDLGRSTMVHCELSNDGGCTFNFRFGTVWISQELGSCSRSVGNEVPL